MMQLLYTVYLPYIVCTKVITNHASKKEHRCIQCNCYFPLPMLLYRNYFCQCNVVYTVLRKILTYIEYRAVSGVFRTIGPSPPLHPASVSSPSTKGWEVHTRRAVRGWGVNITEDARHWIDLLQYNPSTLYSISPKAINISLCISCLPSPCLILSQRIGTLP
jgi:hypothetical protein